MQKWSMSALHDSQSMFSVLDLLNKMFVAAICTRSNLFVAAYSPLSLITHLRQHEAEELWAHHLALMVSVTQSMLCVCVCVCKRERERKKERKNTSNVTCRHNSHACHEMLKTKAYIYIYKCYLALIE